jgi:hypothetical protein
MALITQRRYIYPPNWDETYEDTQGGHRRYTINLTAIFDATEVETNIHKVFLEIHKKIDGTAPSKIFIESVRASVTLGQTAYVKLGFDRDDPNEHIICVLSENSGLRHSDIVDNGTGGTGDIILTTFASAAGDTYDITMTYRVK